MLSYGPWPCMSSCRLPTSHRVSTVLSHPACMKPGSISPHPVLPPSPLVDSILSALGWDVGQGWAGFWSQSLSSLGVFGLTPDLWDTPGCSMV